MTANDFIAHAIITIMDEDPVKILECEAGYKLMQEHDAVFDSSREGIMAEEALYRFKQQNPQLPEIQQMTDDDETEIENLIAAAIIEKEW